MLTCYQLQHVVSTSKYGLSSLELVSLASFNADAQDLSCTYLAHDELESVVIIIIYFDAGGLGRVPSMW